MTGYIKLFRKVELNPVLQCKHFDRFHAWVWLIERANFKPVKIRINGETIQLERGQLWTSTQTLANTFGWSKATTWAFLTDLEAAGMIKKSPNANGTVLTIENYTFYQDAQNANRTQNEISERSPNDLPNAHRTAQSIEIPMAEGTSKKRSPNDSPNENYTQDKKKEEKEKEADDFQSRYERAVAAFGARHPIGELKAGDPRYDESLIRDSGGEDLILLYPEGRKWQEQAMKEKSETRKRLEEKLNRLL